MHLCEMSSLNMLVFHDFPTFPAVSASANAARKCWITREPRSFLVKSPLSSARNTPWIPLDPDSNGWVDDY